MVGKRFDHTDPIFGDFKRIGGKGSGTVIVLDEDTDEVVFIAKITEHPDRDDLATFNHVFTYFR